MNDDRENCGDTGECVSGKRNRFYRGKAMKAEEFEAEQSYFIKRRRLINRAVSGWGVVYGFVINGVKKGRASVGTASPDPIQIGPGFALDQRGREIVVVDFIEIDATNTILLERCNGNKLCAVGIFDGLTDASSSSTASGSSHSFKSGKYLLRAHYAERAFGEANLPVDCCCEKPQRRYLCETVLFSLQLSGECPCGESGCSPKCACGPDKKCDAQSRGPHSCLCEWTTNKNASKALDHHLPDERHGVKFDAADGVPLAYVTLEPTDDKCKPIHITVDDDCGPRRLVKNNDLLYDLIRGCDLTRIESISWDKWHRVEGEMPWSEFMELLEPTGKTDSNDVPLSEGVTDFNIRFTGPVLAETVTPDCFKFRFVVASEDTGWLTMRTAPISAVHKTLENVDSRYTREVFLCVAPSWLEEIKFRSTIFKYEGAIVQIDVYGDFILDCHGQAVDANARGFALQNGNKDLGGNGFPGGTFRSIFRVEKRNEK